MTKSQSFDKLRIGHSAELSRSHPERSRMGQKFKVQSSKSELKIFNFLLFTFHFWRSQVGFTLVELLVVIAVIASIMAVLFPNFMGARQRARDTQRKSDLKQIQSAFELYKSDQNPQAYPTGGGFLETCGTCWSSAGDCIGNIYMRKVPCDPGGSGVATYIYATPNPPDPFKYTLSACLENLADSDRDPTPIPNCESTGTSYTVHEP